MKFIILLQLVLLTTASAAPKINWSEIIGTYGERANVINVTQTDDEQFIKITYGDGFFESSNHPVLLQKSTCARVDSPRFENSLADISDVRCVGIDDGKVVSVALNIWKYKTETAMQVFFTKIYAQIDKEGQFGYRADGTEFMAWSMGAKQP